MAKKVFFCFHYQDVKDFRANVVRKHWITKKDREDAGFYDSSLWEATKKQGVIALKRLINSGLENTTVTVVLIGSDTYARRWVRYEIMKSLERGNKIIGIHINGIKGKDEKTKKLGPNPFDYLGFQYSDDGKKLILGEYKNSWINYSDLDAYPISQANRSNWGKFYKLSSNCPTYLWNKDNGYDNFSSWIS